MKYILGYAATASFLFPVIAGVKKKLWLKSVPDKVFFIYIVVALTQVTIEIILAKLSINNHSLSDAFHIFEVIIFSVLFFLVAISKSNKVFFIIASVFFVLFLLYGKIVNLENKFPVDMFSVSSRLSLIIISTVSLHHIVTIATKKLTLYPYFWISVGLLLYSATTLVVVGFGRILMQHDLEMFVMAWNINWIMSVAANCLYVKGILCT